MSDEDERTVQVVISGCVFGPQFVDTIMQAIREAVTDGDVIIFDPKKRPRE